MSFYSGFILISSKFYLDRIRIKSRQNVVRVVLSILYRFLFDKTYLIFSKTGSNYQKNKIEFGLMDMDWPVVNDIKYNSIKLFYLI